MVSMVGKKNLLKLIRLGSMLLITDIDSLSRTKPQICLKISQSVLRSGTGTSTV